MTRDGWRGRRLGSGMLAWGLVATAPLLAQSPVMPAPQVPVLAMPQKDMPASWLPSPQYISPDCAQALSGVPQSSCFEGMTLNHLIRMTPDELELLYAQGSLVPIPAGKIRGQALLNSGTKMAVPVSQASRLAWQGKVIHPDGQTAINRFFGVRAIRANVYNAKSWRDGRPALILDYSETSLLYAPYRDEIRQIAPGLYLGLMFDRTMCPPKLKMYFALECSSRD